MKLFDLLICCVEGDARGGLRSVAGSRWRLVTKGRTGVRNRAATGAHNLGFSLWIMADCEAFKGGHPYHLDDSGFVVFGNAFSHG
jgi:hypothetical protein